MVKITSRWAQYKDYAAWQVHKIETDLIKYVIQYNWVIMNFPFISCGDYNKIVVIQNSVFNEGGGS